MPEDFLDRLSRLENKTEAIIPKVLEAGGNVVLAKVRGNLQAVIGRGLKTKSRSTGELVSALGLSPAKLDRNGNFNVKVGFREPRRGAGNSNAMLGNILEYGKHGQPPKPFLKPARAASRTQAIEAMKRKLEEEVGNV
jgi:HK97 gp10 family phage protein